MREILFRGKRVDNGEWVEGNLFIPDYPDKPTEICIGTNVVRITYEVIPETVGQYTGLTDKNGTKIFEGDIVQYQTYDDFICTSVVKLGKYKQDGSSGEYNGIDCIGYYVEVIEFICPDWCDEDFYFFHEHLKTQNILEVEKKCKVIGNNHDKPKIKEETK